MAANIRMASWYKAISSHYADPITEMEMSSFRQTFHDWLYWKLSYGYKFHKKWHFYLVMSWWRCVEAQWSLCYYIPSDHKFLFSFNMMTSSNGNVFCVTGPLCGEFTGQRWIPLASEFPSQRPVMQSFDDFFDLRLNKRLSKQSWGWGFEMPLYPLWHHRNDL